jgi:UDP-2,3-diacylglucosamine pyrophosphatase LpxH
MAKGFYPPENLTTNEQINYLANIFTTARRRFTEKLFKNEREHQIPPADGKYKRYTDEVNARMAEMEQRQSQQLSRIEEKTSLIEGVTHMFASFWKHSAVKSEELYPTNKDTKRRK